MKDKIKNWWNRIMCSKVLPNVIAILIGFTIVSGLVAAITFFTKLTLTLLGVI